MSEVEKLINFWSNYSDEIHPSDRSEMGRFENRCRTEFYADAFNGIRDSRFHKKLGAMPYIGNLKTASMFLLMINPGVSFSDYKDKKNEKNSGTKELFRKNLSQNIDYCFALSEDGPQGWSPYYLNKVFGRLLASYPQQERKCVIEKLRLNLAILELIPYFSPEADRIKRFRMHESLPSSLLAQSAAQELASEGKLLITRWESGEQRWGLVGRTTQSKVRQGLSTKAVEAIKERLDTMKCSG